MNRSSFTVTQNILLVHFNYCFIFEGKEFLRVHHHDPSFRDSHKIHVLVFNAKEGTTLKVTSIINQKGGVAKTTTSINIAAAWASQGQSILLIDLDPQSSATKSVFGDKEFDKTIYDVLVTQTSADEAIVTSDRFGIDVIPGEIMLSGIDIQLAPQFGRENFLKRKLKNLRRKYDHIVIDCSPSL